MLCNFGLPLIIGMSPIRGIIRSAEPPLRLAIIDVVIPGSIERLDCRLGRRDIDLPQGFKGQNGSVRVFRANMLYEAVGMEAILLVGRGHSSSEPILHESFMRRRRATVHEKG